MKINEVMGGEAPWMQTLRQLLKKGDTVMFAPRVSKLFKIVSIEDDKERYLLKLSMPVEVNGKETTQHSLGFIAKGDKYELKIFPDGKHENHWWLKRA